MKNLIKNNEGFTLAEVMVTTAVGVIIIASILNLTIITQRFSAAILNQISVNEAMKTPTDMLMRDIRNAVRFDIFASYPMQTPAKNGEYIHLYFPSGHGLSNVGYYVLNDELRKITDLAADDASTTADDKLITSHIKSNNVFRSHKPLILRIKFEVQNKSEKTTGRKTGKVDTYINLRN